MNGKQRNNYHYRDLGIDWMVGVTKEGQCWYYPHHIFTHHELIDIRVVPPGEFGIVAVISSQPSKHVFDASSSSLFYDPSRT